MNDAPDARLSVVQTVASLDSRHGGVSRVVPQLADALSGLGCGVRIVTMPSKHGVGAMVMPDKVQVLAASAISIGDHHLWSARFARQIAAGFAPDMPRLLHDNGLWGYTNRVAARFAARHQVPLVISPHGMLEPWALQAKAFRKRVALALYQRKILDSAAALMVTSHAEYESVRRVGLRQPVAVIPLGVPTPASKARHPEQADRRTILFVSRIHPKKGLLALVEAWHRVSLPGWRILVAGPDEEGHLAQVRARVERLGLQAQIEFQPEVEGDQKRALFEAADAFVLPTYSENFGIVVAEALSYGLPVLTTRGAPWSVLEEIGAGWWVEPGVEGLAGGLRALLSTTASHRARMGEAGRAYAASHLGWGGAARATLESYAWVLGLRPDRPAAVRSD